MATVGVIVSGRPVLIDAQVVSPTQYAFQIPSQPSFSHIVASQTKLLGAIANEKPSAIFKITDKAGGPADDAMLDDGMSDNAAPLALGISVEPAEQVAAGLAQQKAVAASAAMSTDNAIVLRGQNSVTTKVLAQRIIKNCYDFLTSWGSGDTVPLKAFQAWWTKFEGKIERDPGFLERSDGG
jgi:hypothetical protein